MRACLRPLCAGLALAAGCVSDGTTVSDEPDLSLDSSRRVFLVAAREKPRIRDSLTQVGFEVVADLLDAPYLLRVTLGVKKGRRDCGVLSNVKYALRENGETILELKGAGWTGSCEPNVFDAMSLELRELFAPGTASEEGE